ncbi:hypothetical protein [Scytonema hofmannii]|uniref:hypothetical protein n=1 Tax=Scytonema hofmannii TaxID=34078 RepID=UPI0003473A11|nr:hypothetical protein [Scytonema hofmannii]
MIKPYQSYWAIATLTIVLLGYALIKGLWILYLIEPKLMYTTGLIILLIALITASALK